MHFNITTASQMAASQLSADESSTTAEAMVASSQSASFLANLFGAPVAPANVTTASVSSKLWKLLRTNTSSVHLHILAVKTSGIGAPKGAKKRTISRTGGSSDADGPDSEGELAVAVDADIEALGGLDEVTSGLLKDGRALYDVVGMVKWDVIPKAYSHRYLLKDVPFVVSG